MWRQQKEGGPKGCCWGGRGAQMFYLSLSLVTYGTENETFSQCVCGVQKLTSVLWYVLMPHLILWVCAHVRYPCGKSVRIESTFCNRERERDYIVIVGGQIQPMRQKKLHFTWYMWKWLATLDVQELYQGMLQSRVRIVVVREIRARIELGWRCVESMVEYDLRQSIVSKCDTHILELV